MDYDYPSLGSYASMMLFSRTGSNDLEVQYAELDKMYEMCQTKEKIIEYVLDWIKDDSISDETISNALTVLINNEDIVKTTEGYRLNFDKSKFDNRIPPYVLPVSEVSEEKILIDRRSAEYIVQQVQQYGFCVLTVPMWN